MWYVYIVKCFDETYYTGITTDVDRRIDEHSSGKGAKYTRSRIPVQLEEFKEFKNRSEASKEEARIKKLTRVRKEKLIGEWRVERLRRENVIDNELL
jgi:putative endonuclease